MLHKINILFVEYWNEFLKYYYLNLDYFNIAYNIWNFLGMIQYPSQDNLSLMDHHSMKAKAKRNLGHCMPLQITI